MLDLKKFNQLFGTTYASIEEITNQNLFMAWVALTADSLGLAIIDQTRSLQSVREKEYKMEYQEAAQTHINENVTLEDCNADQLVGIILGEISATPEQVEAAQVVALNDYVVGSLSEWIADVRAA